MCWDEDSEDGVVACAELGLERGGTEYRSRNSERFLRISSREATLEGLEKDESKGLEGFAGIVGFL